MFDIRVLNVFYWFCNSDLKWRDLDEPRVMYGSAESLYRAPETNIT